MFASHLFRTEGSRFGVLPVAFLLIGYRYSIWCLRSIRDILHRLPRPKDRP